eukprot:CAMPEP_0118854330 /NCGR_PEP_ID=MMETSP1163-20130328/2587_1 /TAXON_ID=124430 /ORGANISM="Phaeomonas parva, Strain CCMP2877" /LENGTH=43 /DNA_ID= /DNA_START= /DNA_END= /DNA_ORIENTATION=
MYTPPATQPPSCAYHRAYLHRREDLGNEAALGRVGADVPHNGA